MSYSRYLVAEYHYLRDKKKVIFDVYDEYKISIVHDFYVGVIDIIKDT